MKTITEILARLNERKAKLKAARKLAQEALALNPDWSTAKADGERARAKVKELRLLILGKGAVEELDALALGVRQDAQLLSDIAITAYLKGESVAANIDGKEYEPSFKVSFKQLKLGI